MLVYQEDKLISRFAYGLEHGWDGLLAKREVCMRVRSTYFRWTLQEESGVMVDDLEQDESWRSG